jgi:hypothetical protein
MPERKTRKASKRDAHDFLSKAEQFLRRSWGLGEFGSWKSRIAAKFWLDPEPSLASCWGMTANELNGLEYVVRENVALFRSKWDERFST